MEKSGRKTISVNKRARHDYEFLQTYEAGLVLTGTEVKSLRDGNVSIREAFGRTNGTELFLHGLDIAEYGNAGYASHDPTRKRKLLLRQQELKKIIPLMLQRGLALVPTRLYFRGGWAKVEVAVARGKKHYDKRESLKKRDHQREMQRAIKENR